MPQLTSKEETACEKDSAPPYALFDKNLHLPAGGSKEALMATPTRLDVWSSRTLRATPNPLKKAIGMPAKKVSRVPRLIISEVGP
jgi:hypothetical protein